VPRRPQREAPLQRPAEPGLDLADNAAAEGKHAGDEDHALHHRHPGAELGKLVLHRDDDERADGRAEDRAYAADQRHQHCLAAHRPVHVGQRRELDTIALVPPATPVIAAGGRRR
jgi:hypothetical protein